LTAAALLIALGIFIVVQAVEWPYLNKDGPGPGFFPLWTGICLIALATALVVLQVLHAIRHGPVDKTNWAGAGRVLAGWLGLMIAIALLKPAGFIVSFLLLTVFLVTGIFRRPLMVALAVGLGSSIGFWVLFVMLLEVQLPAGPWGF
jgi:putative tricarboxylic transport membrane protein